MNQQRAVWALRLGAAGEFLGHGALALGGKEQWVGWTQKLLSVDLTVAGQILFIVGLVDVILAVIVLFRPIRPLLLWMAIWGFWTALLRPLVGESWWDFIERFANWGAPLALFYLTPKKQV